MCVCVYITYIYRFPQERGGSDRSSTSAATEALAEDSLLRLPLWANRSLEARSVVFLFFFISSSASRSGLIAL